MRTVTALLIASLVSACSSWHTEHLTPQQVVDTKRPDRVRVTLADGARVVLQRPHIAADSLVGVSLRPPTTVPLRNVARIDTRRFSAGKTIALALAIPGALVGVLAIYCASEGCNVGN